MGYIPDFQPTIEEIDQTKKRETINRQWRHRNGQSVTLTYSNLFNPKAVNGKVSNIHSEFGLHGYLDPNFTTPIFNSRSPATVYPPPSSLPFLEQSQQLTTFLYLRLCRSQSCFYYLR